MHGHIRSNTEQRKIFNDPVYGFITIPGDFIFRVVEHPYFQRLRRIKQLGLAELVYPGAVHSRFQHALGAMHLMHEALLSLEAKGVKMSDQEKEGALLAILLHDIGHGPFSHVLEHSLFHNVSHECISELLIARLNVTFEGRLDTAIAMFNGSYPRKFFHQLVSGQLDMDRMDYLNRDSFFTAVAEGKIGAERIIKMLHVANDELVVEEKGLMSVENFLVARQHMYWQVYLHKTAICAETVLLKVFQRVKDLLKTESVPMGASLLRFLGNEITLDTIQEDPTILEDFVKLDDNDIWFALKIWADHSDQILSVLSKSLLDRNLFKIKFDKNYDLGDYKEGLIQKLNKAGISKEHQTYFYREGKIKSSGYDLHHSSIKILWKDGNTMEISEASELPTIRALSNIVEKNYLCYANDVYLREISDRAENNLY